MIIPLRLALILMLAAGVICSSYAQTKPISVRGQSARVPIQLDQKEQRLTLCELIPGKTYRVQLVPAQPGSQDGRLSFGRQLHSQVIQFQADTACEELVAHTDGSFTGYLSAYCAACRPTVVEKMMMGITTTPNNNATFLIEDVFIGGGCFDIAGVSSRGVSHQLGTFDNGTSSIDIESGVILSTGDVSSATGPNNLSSTSGSGGGGGDPDLSDLTTGSINDVVALEFDFTPTIDQISFQYVFSSEEYCEFVNSSFNDVFGFFISGPGINGPFANGAENIALIPGTGTYVSINNVNGGSNSNYYLNNLNPAQHACNSQPPVAYDLIEYDGFTTVLTAVANVIPCQTYHIKLVLADVGDGTYDSAVFLKANSFNPGNYATGSATIVGAGPTDDTAYEGCGDASITFSRTSDDVSADYIVSYILSPNSTATMGVDFSVLPNPIIIPAGQQSITINLGIIADNLPEGVETVILELEEPCSCTTGSIEIYIEDPPPLQIAAPPIVACEGAPVTITPDVIGGTPGYSYVWGDGSSNPSLTVTPPLGISNYTVAVTDECGQTANATIEVIADAPTATLSGAGTICQGNFQTFLQVAFTGLGPWTITYAVDGVEQTVSDIFFTPLNLPVDLPGNYELISVVSNGCEGNVDGTALVGIEEVLLDPQIEDVSCFGAQDGSIQLDVSGGNGPYAVDWPNPLPDDSTAVNGLAPGYYQVTVTDANGCQAIEGIALSEPTELTVDLVSTQDIDCTNPEGGSIVVEADGGTGLYSFSWNNGASTASLDSIGPGDYAVTVTDDAGCTAGLAATIADNIEAPTAAIAAPGLLTCAQTSIELNAQNSSSGPDISFQWTTLDGNILTGADQPTPEIDDPGTYLLTVIDNGNACTDTAQVTVLENTTPPQAEAGLNDTLTCTINTLSLSADSSSIGPGYTYIWNTSDGNLTGGENSLQPTVDAPGTYELLVTDIGNGCTAGDQVTIFEDVTPPVLSLADPVDLTCDQTSVPLSAAGSDTGPSFQYTWSTDDGTFSGPTDSLTITADAPGLYALTILNTGNGCSSNDSLIVAQDIAAPLAEAGPGAELDCATSSATLDGGGSSPGSNFTYEWSTNNGNVMDGGDGLSPVVSQPGLYFLTVIDTDNGCTAIDSVQISENSNAPTAIAEISGLLTCDATSLTIDATGSDSGNNFEITWSSQEGHAFDDTDPLQLSVDQPGVYLMTITDLSNSCVSTATVQVQQNITSPQAEAGAGFELNCNLPESSLDGTASSQGPGFSYEWTTDDGTLAGDPTSLSPLVTGGGAYTLRVADTENGCVALDSVFIEEDKTIPVADAGADATLDCDTPNFTLQGQGSSSGPAFTYEWMTDNGLNLPGELNPSIDQPGIYELSVTNTENGCSSQDIVEVTADFAIPTADAGPAAVLNCDEPQLNLDGTASSQGTEFIYTWTTEDGSILAGADTLVPLVDAAGLYQLIVLNVANACADTASVALTEDFTAPVADAGPPQRITCEQPIVTLGGFSDSGPDITYDWTTNDGALNNNANQPDPGVTAGGTYLLTVVNTANGCQSTDQVIIQEDQEKPVVQVGPDQLLNCAQSAVTLVTDGSSEGPEFTYQWSTGTTTTAPSGASPTVSLADTYILSILNTENGCLDSDTVTVAANFDTPVAEAGDPATLNCTQPVLDLDGTASTQGTGIALQWTTSDGNILQNAGGPMPLIDAAGLYQLVVINTESQCSDTATVIIDANFTVPISVIQPVEVLTCEMLVLTLNGSNSSSSSSIIYNWTTTGGNITGSGATPNTTIDAAGVYNLEVIDTENGCTASTAVVVDSDQDLPAADAGEPLVLSCEDPSLPLDGSASESGPDLTYQWSTGDGLILSGSNSLSPVVGGAGEYELTVLNTETGCLSVATVEVEVDTLPPQAMAGTGPIITCSEPFVTLDGTGSSSGNALYNWQGPGIQSGADTPAPTVSLPGLYNLVVTDPTNGCSASDQVQVAIDTLAPVASIAEPALLTCDLTSQQLTAESTGNGPLSFLWTTAGGQIADGANTLFPTVAAAGSYQLLVTNEANGCAVSAAVTVAIDTLAPMAEAGEADQIDCDHPVVTLDGTGSAPGNHSYEWTTDGGSILSGATGLTPTVGEPGVYWLTVTDLSNGCQSVDFVEVPVDEAVPALSLPTPERLTCVNEWVTLTGQADTGLEFQWYDTNGTPLGLDNPTTIEVNQPGTYQLVVTDLENGCSASEWTLVVQDVELPLAEAGTGEELNCEITSVRLDGDGSSQGPGFTYQWSTPDGFILSGASTLQPVVNQAGNYQLLVTNTDNGCTANDELTITEEVPESMHIDTQEPPCYGDSGAINVGNVEGGYGPYLYSINGGQSFQSQSSFPDLSPGLFEVVVQDANGCELNEDVIIPVPVELQLFLESTEVITLGESYRLNAQVNITEEEIASVKWTPDRYLSCTDCLDPLAVQPRETTTYQVTVENQNGCTVAGDLMLIVQRAPVYVPSAFSPFNQDGTNDRFVVYAREKSVKQVKVLQIFNRWGENVYEVYDFPPNDPQYGWDGTHRGMPLNPGVFVYWTEVELIDGSTVLVKGDVSLIN